MSLRIIILACVSLLISCQPKEKTSEATHKLIENLSILDIDSIKIESVDDSLTMEKKSDQWFVKTQQEQALKALGFQVNTLLLLVSNQPRGVTMDYSSESLKKLDLAWPAETTSKIVRIQIQENGKTHTLRLGQLDIPHDAAQDAMILGVNAVARRFVFHEEEGRLSLVDHTLHFITPHLKNWVITKFHPVNRIKQITVSKTRLNSWSASRISPFHEFKLSSGKPLTEKINVTLNSLFETGYFVLPVTQADQELLSESSQHTELKFENFDGYTYHIILGGKKLVQLGDSSETETGLVVSDLGDSVECYAAIITVNNPDGSLLEQRNIFVSCSEITPIL